MAKKQQFRMPTSRVSSIKRQNRLQQFQQVQQLHRQEIHCDMVGRYLRPSDFPDEPLDSLYLVSRPIFPTSRNVGRKDAEWARC